jgi:hypothetical protein
MQSREGWTRAEPGPKVVKGKTYKTLVEYVRGCSVCAKPFSIFVTAKIASGHSDSNSFGLRNCEEHRRSRMHADATELSKLRTANATMADELPGLYERVRLQFEEIQVLKARLAQYELPATMLQLAAGETAIITPGLGPTVIGCDPVQNTTNGALPSKLPWE